MPKRVFITVAEVSGDNHAAELARAIRQLDSSIVLEGHGGSAMREAGVTVHHETVQKASMLLKAVWRAAEIWKLLRWTRQYYQANRPDLHICIDSSGMNLHFAKMARACGVPVLYYIPPQLWASRAGRIKQVKAFVNRVACILPFEQDYYGRRGVAATFVGHPLFDELPVDRKLSVEPRTFSSDSQVPGVPVIGLMPGSRRGEIHANWPSMLDVADQILKVFPTAQFEVPTTPPTHELVTRMAAGHTQMRIEQGAIDRMAPGWDFCIVKSGTSTLHVAAYLVPMIVVYRLNPIAWHLVGRWIVKTPSIALVNILAERSPAHSGVPGYRIVPEIFPWHGPNTAVANLAIDYLQHPEKRLDQRQNIQKLINRLDQPGASRRTAEIVMQML